MGSFGVMSYTIKNLREIEDSAAGHGVSDMEARFPREPLHAQATGLAYLVLKPGKRQPFGHRHEQAEEIYVVLSGSGRACLDEEIVEIGELDAIRIEPSVARRFEAGPDGLALLVFGARHAGDGEMLPDFWSE